MCSSDLNLKTDAFSANTTGSVTYLRRDPQANGDATFTVSAANLSAALTSGLFSADVPATSLKLRRITDSNGQPSWEAESWTATGTLNLKTDAFSANTTGTVTYLRRDPLADGDAAFTLSTANLSGPQTLGLFTGEVQASDLKLQRVTKNGRAHV